MDTLPIQKLELQFGSIPSELYLLEVSPLREPDIFHAALSHLPDSRRHRVLQYRQQKDQRLSLGAGLLLTRGLEELGIRDENLQIGLGPNEKPFLRDYPHIHFNLSHSGQMAIALFSSLEAGCDVEQVGAFRGAVARRCFHPEENAWLFSLPDSERALAFYRLWTLKEAFVKLTGAGLRLPFSDFCIHPEQKEIRAEKNGQPFPAAFLEYPIPGYCIAAGIQLTEESTT